MHKLTTWCIDKIKREYPDDVALLIGVTGHSTNGDGHGEVFDYFVPCTERGNELSRAFIVDGVGHDLYPRSWERLERSATLDEMISVLKNATVLYARTEEDRMRFLALQEKLRENLKDPLLTYRKAAEYLLTAQSVFDTLMFEERFYRAKNDAIGILHYLSSAVAFINGTSADEPLFSAAQAYDSSKEAAIYTCPALLEVPDGFFIHAGKLVTADSIDKCRELSAALIATVRYFIAAHKPAAIIEEPRVIDYAYLAGWYQEMSLTWKRIRYYAEEKLTDLALCDAHYLQSELIAIADEFGIPEYDLLGSFDPKDLSSLRLRADRIECEIRRIITEGGITIDEFDTLEAFLASESDLAPEPDTASEA